MLVCYSILQRINTTVLSIDGEASNTQRTIKIEFPLEFPLPTPRAPLQRRLSPEERVER